MKDRMRVKPAKSGRERLSAPSLAQARARRAAAPFVVAAALTAALADAGQAGPWTREKGGYYSRFSASYLYTRSEFDAGGKEVPILTGNPLVQSAAYRDVSLSSYVEYGLRDRLTLVVSLPFKILTSQRTELSTDATILREVDVTNAGLADLWTGVRYALIRGRYPVAVEGSVKAPLGYDRTPDNGGPALGTGYADAELALAAGYGARFGYATLRAAYRVHGGDLDDAVVLAAEAGGHRGRGFAQLVLEAWRSTGEILSLDVSATAVVPNQDVTKLLATAGFEANARVALTLEAYHVLAGKNAATGTTVALALVMSR
jgi:hypothetical protein